MLVEAIAQLLSEALGGSESRSSLGCSRPVGVVSVRQDPWEVEMACAFEEAIEALKPAREWSTRVIKGDLAALTEREKLSLLFLLAVRRPTGTRSGAWSLCARVIGVLWSDAFYSTNPDAKFIMEIVKWRLLADEVRSVTPWPVGKLSAQVA